MRKRGGESRRIIALFLALLFFAAGAAAEAPAEYMENEWNYVDGSIDPSRGIPADAQGQLAKIREAGRLRVATEPYFAPQEFIDPALSGQEKYIGADMELARLIAERMGVELEIVPMDFTLVLTAVAEGDCDLAISALSFLPSRAAQTTMSKGYHYTEDSLGSGLMIRAEDAAAITDLSSLDGRVIAAQSGSLQESLAAEHIQAYLEFRRLPSVQSLYQALENKEADAVMVDVETAENYIRANPEKGFALLPGVQFQMEPQFEGDRIACKKGELQLMYFVNGVIDEVLSSGLYEDWFTQYTAYAAGLGL